MKITCFTLIALLTLVHNAAAVPGRVAREAAELAAGRATGEAAEAALKRSTNELIEQEIRMALKASSRDAPATIARQGAEPGVKIILAKGGTETATKHFARSWWKEIAGAGAGAGIYQIFKKISDWIKEGSSFMVTIIVFAVALLIYLGGPKRFCSWVAVPANLILGLISKIRMSKL
jgi:hypothetical protein